MKRMGLIWAYAMALAFALGQAGLANEMMAYGDIADEAAAAESSESENVFSSCSGCDCGCSCAEHCRCNGGYWFAGTDITFLKLDVTTGGRATLSLSDTTAPGVASVRMIGAEGIQDFGAAPRIWLGRQITENWGVAGRFWYLNASDSTFPQVVESTGSNFASFDNSTRAELYTIDVEGIRSFELGQWKLDGSVGARYAAFNVDSELSTFGVFTTGNFINLGLETFSSFSGAGITYALGGRRQIGNSPYSVFVSGRGSNLAGTAVGKARSRGTVASSPSAPLVGAATVTRRDTEASATIAEFQLGLQRDFELAHLPVNAFVRVAAEAQLWSIHARAVGGAGFGGTIGDLTTNSFASAAHGDATLYGLAVTTGFTW